MERVPSKGLTSRQKRSSPKIALARSRHWRSAPEKNHGTRHDRKARLLRGPQSVSPRRLAVVARNSRAGQKKIKALYDKLGIASIEQLEQACKGERSRDWRALAKNAGQYLRGSLAAAPCAARRLYSNAWRVSEPLLDCLRQHPDVIRCSTAGSLRRCKEIIGDIDFLVSSKNPAAVIDYFTGLPDILSVNAKGDTKASIIVEGGIQSDLRVVSDAEFPFALAYFTGGKEHNIVMRQRAIERGLRLNEYGLFRSKEETRDPNLLVPCKTEEEIFQHLGLPYIPPELREDMGEFAAAEKGSCRG